MGKCLPTSLSAPHGGSFIPAPPPMARLGPSLSRADLPSYCMRSLAPGRLRPLPPSSTSLRPPSPASCEQQTSLPPTLDLGVSKPSSVGGGQSLRFCQVAGAGVRARIRQVWVHATEGARELAGAYVPSRGLQMCLRIWEAAPGERRQKNGASRRSCRVGG